MAYAYEIMRETPRDKIDMFNAPPEFHVAGLPGMRGTLYAKLILQIIQDQLSSLEAPMGVPVRYRLSQKQRSQSTQGIFSSPERSGLLGIVMSQAVSGVESTGEALLESLRDSFKKLAALLEN